MKTEVTNFHQLSLCIGLRSRLIHAFNPGNPENSASGNVQAGNSATNIEYVQDDEMASGAFEPRVAKVQSNFRTRGKIDDVKVTSK